MQNKAPSKGKIPKIPVRNGSVACQLVMLYNTVPTLCRVRVSVSLFLPEHDCCRTLFAQRDGARSVKSTKACLRTVFSNFGRPLADLDPTWLVLLTRAEFEEATSASTKAAAAPPQCSESRSDVVADAAAMAVLNALSPGFDERAAAALTALRTVPCVA